MSGKPGNVRGMSGISLKVMEMSGNCQGKKSCPGKTWDCVTFIIFHYSVAVDGTGFYPRDAMLARVFAIATCLSVRPSVRPSVRRAPVLCLAERKQDREMYTV